MPAESTRIFAALRPDERLGALVQSCKRRLLAACGPQLYATDPPHTTLYLAEFAAARIADVLRAAGQIAGSIAMPSVIVDGWQIFESDPLTGRHTLALRFDEGTCQRLRMAQVRALDALVPLHDSAATQRALEPRRPHLAPQQQRCVRQFGFPFVGAGWIPHVTIASVNPEQWPLVAEVFSLRAQGPEGRTIPCSPTQGAVGASHKGPLSAADGFGPPAGTYEMIALDLYELHGLEPHPLASFALAAPRIGKVA
jgi:2'-5' RNA ligase